MCKCGKKYINPQHFKRHQKKCPQAEYGKFFVCGVFIMLLLQLAGKIYMCNVVFILAGSEA